MGLNDLRRSILILSLAHLPYARHYDQLLIWKHCVLKQNIWKTFLQSYPTNQSFHHNQRWMNRKNGIILFIKVHSYKVLQCAVGTFLKHNLTLWLVWASLAVSSSEIFWTHCVDDGISLLYLCATYITRLLKRVMDKRVVKHFIGNVRNVFILSVVII